jgi:hypothetical protein
MRVRSDQGATLSLCCCLLSAVTSSKIDFLGIHKPVLYREETASTINNTSSTKSGLPLHKLPLGGHLE